MNDLKDYITKQIEKLEHQKAHAIEQVEKLRKATQQKEDEITSINGGIYELNLLLKAQIADDKLPLDRLSK